jgi:hypothetical protein
MVMFDMLNGTLKEPLIKTLLYLTESDWYHQYWEDCLNKIKDSSAFDEKGEIDAMAFEAHPLVEFLVAYFENYLLLGNLTGANRLALEEIRDFIMNLKNPQLFESRSYFG